jgi:diguanylate cyclase
MTMIEALRTRVWPHVPAEIRDELAVLRYARLQRQIPILYLTLIAVITAAMLAAADGAPWWVRIGIPTFVISAGIVRFLWWTRQRGAIADADTARRHIRRTVIISTSICALCSIWCIASWLMSAPEQRSYYPLFMAMGSLTTAFSLSVIRFATLTNLVMGIAPMALAMMTIGGELDRLAGLVVAIATMFLVRMVGDQHRQLIDLLLLKHQLREQANTDPLTGLRNRRALIAAAERAFAEAPGAVSLALFDLDGFKAVNDRHGHAVGDDLLVEVAQRLRRSATPGAVIARLGGDEFALLLVGEEAGAVALQVDRMLAALVPPFNIGSAPITLGASAGMARAPGEGTSLTELFAAADTILYTAKASRPKATETGRRVNRAA